MTTAVLPDTEALVCGYLAAQLPAASVHSQFPTSPTYPVITVHRAGGTPVHSRWLDRAVLQVDVWADSKEEARDVAATAYARLKDMTGPQSYGGQSGVVSATGDVTGLAWLRDEFSDKPRYTFQVSVYVHP